MGVFHSFWIVQIAPNCVKRLIYVGIKYQINQKSKGTSIEKDNRNRDNRKRVRE